ncbi:MAG TPA: 2-oxoglutarate dehydrogenase E1 component [Ktedonobacterales bacterium]|nr:2-oxoglutarate dehydrogenase E1 component [Ktedonobacterales bacterium]
MMSFWDDFYGPNAGYALELYERYLRDPESVDAATRARFAALSPDQVAVLDAALTATAAPALPAASAPATTGAGTTVAARAGGQEASASAPAAVATRPIPMPAPSGNGATAASPAPLAGEGSVEPAILIPDVTLIVRAARLARSIREYGHLAARIDPLGTAGPGDPMLDPATHDLTDAELAALPASIVWPSAGPRDGTFLDAIRRLRAIYEGTIGYDFDHVQDYAERAWLHDNVEAGTFRDPLPSDERRAVLRRLVEVAEFERFLHTTFQGQKRFSIEGLDVLVPMLDELIHEAAIAGTREVLIGMAHRGRLSVLAHVLKKPFATIFAEFHKAPNKELVPSEGSAGINYGWTGDVKYHLGASKLVRESDLVQVQLTLAHNPSHLEFVNPVVEGYTRAAQETRDAPGSPRQHPNIALAVTIHGDAAFPGEGVVAETLNLSRLPGYQTGGTVHVIANNQIGFTTTAGEGRSTLYASDLAKGFEIPIIHVNADDVEGCLSVVRLAHAYRQRFHKDILIDLVGYRRWGHNEGDEPAFTQPVLYGRIAEHPEVARLYAEELEEEDIATAEDVARMHEDAVAQLKAAYAMLDAATPETPEALPISPPLADFSTPVPAGELRAINEALLARPEGFSTPPRLERLLLRRREHLEKPSGIDWAHAEALAFGAILAAGTPIRMTGQDTERGTFSQRHLVLHDVHTGRPYTPLQALPQARASFAVYNSPLSEAAALGFEYGYSVHAPTTLVLWEAQFGDFANAAQVLIDQFIAAGRAKWRQMPGLVLLLPHGYEGQGPEHSSGRVERYLQLAAEDNLRVANCTTAAQYYHLLRAQAATLAAAPRPLILMTPKSLLRHPRAATSLADLATGHFQPVLDDPTAADRRERVTRLILCSGKVAVDVAAAAEGHTETERVAVARVELLYPFPAEAIRGIIATYPHLAEFVWLQEEPRNMGAWSYIAPRLEPLLPAGVVLRYEGRPERASPAEGLAEMHAAEQARMVESVLAANGSRMEGEVGHGG